MNVRRRSWRIAMACLASSLAWVASQAAASDGGDEGGRALAFAGSTADPKGPGLPKPWSHEDVGDVTVEGDARHEDGVFTLSGTLDIWGKADGFHFAYRTLDGDGEVVARVNEVENTAGHAKAGVMIRESLAADARHATMVVTPVDGTQFLVRREPGNVTMVTKTGRDRGKLPYWVKLVRKGNTFTAYESEDGQDWVKAGTETVRMGRQVDAGLVSSSHEKSKTSTAKLDHVKVDSQGP